MPSGCVRPLDLRKELADLRIFPQEMTIQQISFLVPRLAEIDERRDDSPARMAEAFARSVTDHAVGTYLAEHGLRNIPGETERRRPFELLCIHLSLAGDLGAICQAYRHRSVARADPDASSPLDDAATQSLMFLDLALGRYMHLLGRETTMIVTADPPSVPNQVVGSLRTTEPEGRGFFVAAGPGIRKQAHAEDARTVDVAPTVLALLGIEPACDMDGVVLKGVLEADRVAAIPEPVWTHEHERVTDNPDRLDRLASILSDLRDRGYEPSPRPAVSADGEP